MDEYRSSTQGNWYFTSTTSETYINMWVDDICSAYWTANLSRREETK